MGKYVLFIPHGGLNDILSGLKISIDYCKQYHRTLLFAMKSSCYLIELNEYFVIEDIGVRILYNTEQIKQHLTNKTVYHFDLDLNKVIDCKIIYGVPVKGIQCYNNVFCQLPEEVVEEDVILYVRFGGGRGYEMFKHFRWKDSLKELCRIKRGLLTDHYLCIHVRCTDYQCDYQKLYEDNKQLIHSYPAIYLATDNEEVVQYFRSNGLNVYCFTTFPLKKCHNLHTSTIDPHTLFSDIMVDVWMATHSDRILSNSKGGFIRLLRDCFENKSFIRRLSECDP